MFSLKMVKFFLTPEIAGLNHSASTSSTSQVSFTVFPAYTAYTLQEVSKTGFYFTSILLGVPSIGNLSLLRVVKRDDLQEK